MPKKDTDNNTFQDLIEPDLLEQIKKLHNKTSSGDEFEVMFFNYKQKLNRMGMENFVKVLEYMTYRSKAQKLELKKSIVLDLCYRIEETGEYYRISVDGLDSINKYMEMLHLRKNHVIFSVLANLSEKEKEISILKKDKNHNDTIDVDDFDIRFRLAKERKLQKAELEEIKELDETKRHNITFRYKQRTSLVIKNGGEGSFTVDLTNTKMTTDINKIHRTAPIYELEIDYSPSKTIKAEMSDILKEINILLKVIHQSNYLISKTQEKEILKIYAGLIGVDLEKIHSLESRKAVSLEVQHVVDKLPNKYAVSDKADGERYFLIISNQTVYLISDTLHVKNTGIHLEKKEYDNTILDGEYIFIKGVNRYVFLAFDCLYHKGENIRSESSFLKRLTFVDDVVNNCFVSKDQKGYKFQEYDGPFDIKKLVDFHSSQIEKFMIAFNADLRIDKHVPLIRRKYFIPVLGGQDNEIFKYGELMWNKYTKDEKVGCPYILDGLIFHPLDQKYVASSKESTYLEYKWKPPEKNSIDFYVQYERSQETNEILVLYDNSREEYVRGKAYQIARLYVGKTTRTGEQPVLFKPEINKHVAHLFLRDGEVRDLEGNIIQDKTVVEFYYNNDPNIPEEHRWTPMRTRYDKTELVQLYRRKFGNYSDIATRVWRSIENPVLIGDFNILAKDETFGKHFNILRGKIDHSVILSERQENKYYQIVTNLAKGMRAFHNFIKSNMIYTNCNPVYEGGRSMSILDFGCGRGGDLMKFYYVTADFYVGIDKNNADLISPVDGAISRYNQHRKKKPNFPNMFFVNADLGALLEPEEQAKVMGTMTRQNLGIMKRFFSKDPNQRTMFDRINCQFTIHYLLENEIIWNNFCQNIKNYLKPGGQMLITTFDATLVRDLLKDKGQFTSYYTDQQGEQRVMFEIVKKYDDKQIGETIGLSVPIDVHNATYMQEGNYVTEYLVDKNFMEKEFYEKCDLVLEETDTFENQFFIHEEFFKNYADYESKDDTRKFLLSPLPFYDLKNEDNRASFQFSRLNRLYIFKRVGTTYEKKEKKNDKVKEVEKIKKVEPEKKTRGPNKQKGGFEDIAITDMDEYLSGKNVRRNLDCLKEYSFLASVHDILRTEDIIPEEIDMAEFYNDLGYDLIRDPEISKTDISKLCRNLIIGHDFSASEIKTQVALDKINVIVMEKDCDGYYDIEAYGTAKSLEVGRPSMIFYKEADKYFPVYRMDGGEYSGLFDTSSKEIDKLIRSAGKTVGPMKKKITKRK